MFDLLRGNGQCTRGDVAEFQLPHRQHPQPRVAEHSDIELTPLDILLGDGGSADLLVNEGDALREFLIRVDNGCLRDATGSVLGQALDEQRQRGDSPGA